MFEFKFKAVLAYKKQIEDVRQRAFCESRQRWESEKHKLEQDYETWKHCLDEWRVLQHETVSIWQIDLYRKYMLRLRHQLTLQAERVRTCMHDMDTKRGELLAARKAKKQMEMLEASHQQEYLSGIAKREARYFDEIATQRYILKGKKK